MRKPKEHTITPVYRLTPPKEEGKPYTFTIKRVEAEGAEAYCYQDEDEANEQRRVIAALLGVKVR